MLFFILSREMHIHSRWRPLWPRLLRDRLAWRRGCRTQTSCDTDTCVSCGEAVAWSFAITAYTRRMRHSAEAIHCVIDLHCTFGAVRPKQPRRAAMRRRDIVQQSEATPGVDPCNWFARRHCGHFLFQRWFLWGTPQGTEPLGTNCGSFAMPVVCQWFLCLRPGWEAGSTGNPMTIRSPVSRVTRVSV